MSAILCRSVPDRASHTTSSNPAGVSSPQESCSPITLEYAEELLLMAYDGRCGVMDVSQVAKECPSGIHNHIKLLLSEYWVSFHHRGRVPLLEMMFLWYNKEIHLHCPTINWIASGVDIEICFNVTFLSLAIINLLYFLFQWKRNCVSGHFFETIFLFPSVLRTHSIHSAKSCCPVN